MKLDALPIDTRESGFDLRSRAELALAYDPGQPPAHLFRPVPQPWVSRRGVQRSIGALLLLGTGVSGVLAMRPPELVRGAIEHEFHERMLRGNFMGARQMLDRLGLKQQTVPGAPQLMRPCDIDGQRAYHLTTFFDKGGMVAAFAFERPVALQAGSGWWGNVHWQVVASPNGQPLVLVAQRKQALQVAQAAFAAPVATPKP